jgi:hypothetical protein
MKRVFSKYKFIKYFLDRGYERKAIYPTLKPIIDEFTNKDNTMVCLDGKNVFGLFNETQNGGSFKTVILPDEWVKELKGKSEPHEEELKRIGCQALDLPLAKIEKKEIIQ